MHGASPGRTSLPALPASSTASSPTCRQWFYGLEQASRSVWRSRAATVRERFFNAEKNRFLTVAALMQATALLRSRL